MKRDVVAHKSNVDGKNRPPQPEPAEPEDKIEALSKHSSFYPKRPGTESVRSRGMDSVVGGSGRGGGDGGKKR